MENTLKTKWGIDPTHSEVSFKVKHLMITNVKGVFKNFNASIYTSGDNFITSEIDLRINTESVDTGVADRDAHLKSADFFDVENFADMHFIGSSLEKIDDESYTLYGDLTIKDVTKQVKLDVEFGGVMKDPWGNEKAGYSINGKINRKDFGLTWNAALEAGGVLVSDDVKISCEVQLIKQA
ncbi:MAG: YceI family protein [Prolixibacteraceae bacterium]|nr:YceI family protein [Prolixibacteraceae bacterium]